MAVLAAIVGQALILSQLGLLLYAAATWLVVAAFGEILEEFKGIGEVGTDIFFREVQVA